MMATDEAPGETWIGGYTHDAFYCQREAGET
jgi:hypothetical protein